MNDPCAQASDTCHTAAAHLVEVRASSRGDTGGAFAVPAREGTLPLGKVVAACARQLALTTMHDQIADALRPCVFVHHMYIYIYMCKHMIKIAGVDCITTGAYNTSYYVLV